MRRFFVMLVVVLWSAGGFAADDLPARDRAAILAAVEDWDVAWKTRDAALAARNYAPDAEWTNAFGMSRRGEVEIRKLLDEVFALPFVMSGESKTVDQVLRILKPDVVLVVTRVERVGQRSPSGGEVGTRRTTHHRVFQKRGGRWQIVSHLISDARDTQQPAH
jgi:uncharacterized protein (TIGR02246 family)